MATFTVKRPAVAGSNDPSHAVSKLVWETPLEISGEVAIAQGGTGGATAAAARVNLDLSADTRPINTQTGTAYTLLLSDKGGVLRRTNAAANTTTVPTNAVVAFPIGAQVDLVQFGAGQSAVAASGGVTIRSAGGKLKLTGQYSAASLLKVATDEWLLFGDIAA